MSGGGRKAADSGGEEAEVEALLRAAQDAVMLKLQANSHLVSSSSSSSSSVAAGPNLHPSLDPAAAVADPLDADLARRFDALRSRPQAPKPKQPDAPSAATAAGAGGMDELEARFAALKGAEGPKKETRVRLEDLGGESDEDEDEDEEVDKVMRWAMDAARLDVVATAGAGKAKSAEEEEEQEKGEKSSSEDDDNEEEEERVEVERERKRKEMMSKNKSKTKWFSLF